MVAQTVIAIAAGGLLSAIPVRPLHWIEGFLFLCFAGWLWRESMESQEADPLSVKRVRHSPWGIAVQSFAVVFVAEFLDLTQVATMAYASRFPRHLFGLFICVALALVAANSTMVFGGRYLQRVVPTKWIQRATALIFLGVAVFEIGAQIVSGGF
jgi:putative Ca2+/H+ antiporter (TMEM165/GDT1 family)